MPRKIITVDVEDVVFLDRMSPPHVVPHCSFPLPPVPVIGISYGHLGNIVRTPLGVTDRGNCSITVPRPNFNIIPGDRITISVN